MDYQDVLIFWFEQCTPTDWFKKSDEFDQLIHQRFAKIHQMVAQGECAHWRATAQGSLAEVIVLDQFSRNIYRDQIASFASDPMALTLAQVAIEKGFDQMLKPEEKSFLYMPFMHSESRFIHQQAVKLFNQQGLENNYQFELAHQAIIERFGRYPHRNAILNRQSSEEELTFFAQPNSSF
ncbi:DUF924 domain-containing protein [Catenovulum sp. SM1970]|uniref:DUF924 family protein n=1 Tax=Marinifaba aquimaris TaxID=2741323 RepID=UPI0015741B0F|nr:DUF924 family protein [Marinifaba aquimaris]NTS76774.1 DUF924 domain-containing protein [Marinifaba aquimaris]